MKTFKSGMAAILLLMVISTAQTMLAQGPPPPPPNGGNPAGPDNELVGGGAPLGNGSVMLLIMAASYAATKWRKRRQKSKVGERTKKIPAGHTLSILAAALILAFQAHNLKADTFTVSNLNDTGDGSLRWAIEQANTFVGPHTIDFSVSGTITLVTALPSITRDYTIIDASSQWQGTWPDGSPGVVINGTNIPTSNSGIYIDASHCQVKGLHITNFSAEYCSGIFLFGSVNSNNTLGGTGAGQRNVINNNYEGIQTRSPHTTIVGNFIGVTTDGLSAAPNNQRGIYINQTSNAIIGGSTTAARNIISGNTMNGILIDGQENHVMGNYIGVNKNGNAAVANNRGIYVWKSNNEIGGSETGKGNVISGNSSAGIRLMGASATHNTIAGNFIGTDFTGAANIPNGSEGGVALFTNSNNNIIGGDSAEARNLISGNSGPGIRIEGAHTNFVKGNYIGTNLGGNAPLPNVSADGGILISYEAYNNVIGGNVPEEGNLISGNSGPGVWIASDAYANQVKGNFIGTNESGMAAIANGTGLMISHGANNNLIGGSTAGDRNLISGNSGAGLRIDLAHSNTVKGNYIGSNAAGDAALSNGTNGGLLINDNAYGNVIGGRAPGEGNLISGNSNDSNILGVRITNSSYSNVLKGNYIGTDADGIGALGNDYGVYIDGGSYSNTIGGTEEGAGNIISGNGRTGVYIIGSGASDNVVQGNIIGLNKLGDFRRNYYYGIDIRNGAHNNTIGGDSEAAGNVISSNRLGGVRVGYQTTGYTQVNGTIIRNNLIGTTLDGLEKASNQQYGVYLAHLSDQTQLQKNVISASTSYGVFIKGGAHTITGNVIGSDRSKTLNLGNTNHGIYMDANGSTIGGTEGNFIAYNKDGVNIAKSNITLYGNTICHNTNSGVRIGGTDGDAQHNIIGGTAAGQANVIHNNAIHGVYVYGDHDPGGYDYSLTDYHRISGNSIYDNGSQGIKLYDSGNGPGTGPAIASPILSTTHLNPETELLTVEGGGAGADATVEVFIADDGTSGEGKTYLGSLTADASKAAGDFSGSIDVSGTALSAGDNIVATTIHTDNNTSEFSTVTIVTAPNSAISAQNGNWQEGTTWIGNNIPEAGDHAVVYEGHEVSVSGAHTCNKLSLKTDATLLVNDGLPIATTAYVFDASSTVNYTNAAKGNQTIEAAATYGNLILSGSGNKTANAALNVAGNMEIKNSAVLLSDHNLDIEGNLDVMGSAQFNPAGNTTVNGNLILSENSSGQNNGLLSIDGVISLQDNAVLTLVNNLNAHSNLNIASNATLNGGSHTIGLAGNWVNLGTWNPGTSTLLCNAVESDQSIGPAASAGGEVQIGEGTSVTGTYPFNNFWLNNRSQMLYQGSDIGASGSITSIQFQLQRASTGSYRDLDNFTVKLKETTDTHWNNQSDYVDMTGALTVFEQNPYQMPDATGWFTIELQTPFTFDHNNNLIIEIIWGPISNYTSTSYNVFYTSASNNCVLYGFADDETPPTYDGKLPYLPNIIFNISAAGGDEAMPFHNLVVDKSNSGTKLTALTNMQVNNQLDVQSGILALEDNMIVQGNAMAGTASRGDALIEVEPDKSLTVNGDLTLKNTGKILLKGTDDPLTNPGILLAMQNVVVEGNGHCVAQRYYQGNYWHLVSSPVANATAGAFTGKVLQYHTENDNNWHDITSVNHLLEPMQGYSLWAFSDAAVLGEFAGTPGGGHQTFDFVSSGGEGQGWNLIGNPYPATLDWDAVTIPASLDATIYLWDPDINDYRYYLQGGPTNTTSQYVALAQGFFVHCNNAAGGTLTFTPDAITAEPAAFYKNIETQQMNTLVYEVQGFPTTAGAVRFREDATAHFDPLLDVYRMSPGEGIPAVYNMVGSSQLAVNSLPDVMENQVVALEFKANTGDYVLNFTGQSTFAEAIPLYLKDKKVNTLTNLRLQDAYGFHVEEGDTASRFELLFMEAAGTNEPHIAEAQIQVQGHHVRIITTEESYDKLQLFSLSGQLLTERDISTGNTSLHIATRGCYIIRLLGMQVTSSSKVIIR